MKRGRHKEGSSCQVVHLNSLIFLNLTHTYHLFVHFQAKSMMLSLSYLRTIPRLTFQKFVLRYFLIVIYIKFDLNKKSCGLG